MSYEFIEVENKGKVTWVTLNRPAAMNSITPDMHHEMQSAFDEFAANDEQFICVVTGAGDKAFCAGSDLKAGIGRQYPKSGYAGLIERHDLSKPIIAAVNGVCLGGGFEVALACDIIIASDNASFGLPEPLVGAIALGGGIHRLVRQIGMKRAMGYLLTGDRMSVEEAFALGLVNEVVAQKDLEACVADWCERILKAAPISVRSTKAIAHKSLGEVSLEAAIRNQADYPEFKAWREAEDTKEGPKAFAEKRSPNWKGR